MAYTTEEQAAMAEASIWDREPNWRRGPPDWDVIERRDLLVWSGPLPERTTNQVVYARWPHDALDHGIAEVQDFFRTRARDFEWIVGPSSWPAGLDRAVEAAGGIREDGARLMAAALPLPAFAVNDDVVIREVTDAPRIRDYLRIAWPDLSPARVEAEVEQRLAYLALPGRRGGWLVAYLAGEPVANATWKDSSDGRCVYLKGAGTRPEFRRRGMYSAVTAYRCERAVERGCTHAAIIAMAETSAPILRRRGFADLGPLPRYVFRGDRLRLDPGLADRLREVGLDPSDPGDPAAAWRRLHEWFGTRATLIDRYALEAAHRRVGPEDLPVEDRRRLTTEALTTRTPGFEVVPASGRAAADPVEVVPYDPRWSSAFSEWREKLQRALGPVAVSIEHIGSTAVPGLAAKPVVDIQVGVRDLDDEASYVPAIEALGVAFRSREPGHRYFRPAGTVPRTVQIHVYQAGSAEARDHLLFRDYLRANASARDAYARMKSDAARLYRNDRIAYNEAKTGFILDELERAREWAPRQD